jgi:thiamine biosynthesis protein ThiI
MMRTAEALAKREGCEAIVMGDSLGQVASQTLKNIRVEQQAVSIPIIRPLIGMDKDQIIRVARDIGTYEISILGAGPCGMVPAKPSTEARLRRILEAEAEMDVGAMVGKALAGMRKY